LENARRLLLMELGYFCRKLRHFEAKNAVPDYG